MKFQLRAGAIILLSTSLMVWYMHFREIDIPKKVPRAALHARIIQKEAPAPYRYRILMPYTAEGLARVLNEFVGSERALLLSYALLEAIAIVALVFLLFKFCLLFFDPLPSLVGSLLANLSLVVALRDHYFQPWSPVNAVVFVLGAYLLYKRRSAAFGALVFISAFNRETSILLPVIYMAASLKERGFKKSVTGFFALLAIWILGYVFVWILQGKAPYVHSLSDILGRNVSAKYLGFMIVNIALFLGGFWIYAAKGFSKAPVFVKRISIYVPVYIVLVIVFGVWKEVRLLMPLYPVLIPAGLSFLFPKREQSEQEIT